VKHSAIRKAFEQFLRTRALKLTHQRQRIFERAFATHEHFTAERLYTWLQDEEGFLESLDTGKGELHYEHVLGHAHHDHMVCLECGRIEEFVDERIEQLQLEAARSHGFQMVEHDLKLIGYCRSCVKAREKRGAPLEGRAARIVEG
jgi:Fur family ferric uptake transcriptional regulator